MPVYQLTAASAFRRRRLGRSSLGRHFLPTRNELALFREHWKPFYEVSHSQFGEVVDLRIRQSTTLFYAMPHLDALSATGRGGVLRIVDRVHRAFTRRLPTIPEGRGVTDRMPDNPSRRLAKTDCPLAPRVVGCAGGHFDVPEMVSNEFPTEAFECEPDVAWVAPVYAIPINQVRFAFLAFATFVRRTHLFRDSEAMKPAFAVRASALDLQRLQLLPRRGSGHINHPLAWYE